MFIEQLFLLYLIGIMIITGIVKKHNLFSNIYNWLYKHIESKKFFVFLYSALGGILPIPGRCVISAGLLDTIATKNIKNREKFGIVDYLSTHHYYFWSPLEKTIIIPMGALSLSYIGLLSYLWPLLLVYLLFLGTYLYFNINDSDVNITISNEKKTCFHIVPLLVGILCLFTSIEPWIVFSIIPLYYIIVTKTYNFKELYSFLNIKLLGIISLVLFGSHFLKLFLAPLIMGISVYGLIIVSILAFLLSFGMGSSSKFSGIVVLLCTTFGIQYLPYFFAICFAGYFLSPMHNCIPISKQYFGTKLQDFYKVMSLLVAIIIIVSLFV